MFAAIMLIINGSSQLIAGLTGIFENEFYVTTPNYFLELDASAWGWIHLYWGVLVLIGGLGLLSGSLWGRTLGMIPQPEVRSSASPSSRSTRSGRSS